MTENNIGAYKRIVRGKSISGGGERNYIVVEVRHYDPRGTRGNLCFGIRIEPSGTKSPIGEGTA